jgi:hypothetical protein
MARRRGRKVTPALIADSQTLVLSLMQLTQVLSAWHPGSIPIAIVMQQLAALSDELKQLETRVASEG